MGRVKRIIWCIMSLLINCSARQRDVAGLTARVSGELICQQLSNFISGARLVFCKKVDIKWDAMLGGGIFRAARAKLAMSSVPTVHRPRPIKHLFEGQGAKECGQRSPLRVAMFSNVTRMAMASRR
ncbi:hypothetical protein JFQ84_004476 [Aeromonas hydrophila]|nr:hypothetical protein [Aeromonas hydrophila]EGX6956249.1 hypothetical protein [Aeromonas hydrophila]MBM0511766.1 hypothetical protein [Aeromonas hydrophila]MBW3771484.1 hypothetical protein [Aeromonas hydrophila]HAT1546471.1 hypothetical protein [Aeromonas hydrophila]